MGYWVKDFFMALWKNESDWLVSSAALMMRLLGGAGFRRKEFRGKLAIAITANFKNRNTSAEAKVEEISGVASIFNQRFFQELRQETGRRHSAVSAIFVQVERLTFFFQGSTWRISFTTKMTRTTL